ncbi:alkaline phosphatase D family protein [Burkholderia ubonensis]|uniref:Alkaline phosphatase n=1 Tax=Burkholderia ubonensis TaxID=101571 RepID=A0ABD4E068_9BURK|nr:alkaline phosphatase D family protein [Burkholderia ubonensis]KVN84916.1 alkaline phosphatase [Burkholderia ubonensis]KVZ69003.1 alkaline phosphatase [Burkholderia ubonensis]KVZ88530.1 alkaline phosphatase [Burkholderia ubonensis]
MDRRHFLKSSAFFTVATAVGALDAPRAAPSAGDERKSRYQFPQGVASGDPRDRSIVFWTRCVPVPGNTPRRRAKGVARAIPLRLEVSTQPDFSALVARVPLRALATYDFTVRAKVTALSPKTTYHYRFVAGDDVSVTGVARTAPDANEANDRIRFAWLTCQDWSVNHWQAMTLLAAESDLDFVVHVGDYIYETVEAAKPGAVEAAHPPLRLPGGKPLADGRAYADTLDDYRTLYRTYRTDPRLQTLHQRLPMIAIWDDHEFSDDCWQDHQVYTNDERQETQRRRSANRAWAEYMPVDWSDVRFEPDNPSYTNIRIYREFHFGMLMHLVMTDERLYRDDHVVSEAAIARARGHDPVHGDDAAGSRYFVKQDVLQRFEARDTAQLGRAPSMLGPVQTQWWKAAMKGSPATWKVWGNEVMLNRLWAVMPGAPKDAAARLVIDCDSWDGYPTHKHELLSYLKEQRIHNVVAISGDLHAFQCGIVRDDPDPATGTPVIVDFVCAGISSTSFYSYIKAAWRGTPFALLAATPAKLDAFLMKNNPDLLHANHDAQGYASATVTPERFSVVFNKVKPLNPDGTAPADALLDRIRLTVPRDSVEVRVEHVQGLLTYP